tara:strand:+ start:192534 stop:193349 length:816 start_codon:yes stop_codon:yes gene_type:complete
MYDSEDFFAKLEREDQEFLALISTMEDNDLYGVLDLNGAAGNGFRNGTGPERTRFKLGAWKYGDDRIHTDELYVEMLLKDGPATPIYPYRLVHLRACVAQHPRGELQAWASEIVNAEHVDEELRAFIRVLKEPIEINDPQLGQFKLNRSVGWFEGALNRQVELSVQANSVTAFSALLPTTNLVLDNLKQWMERAKALAVEELLDTYNAGWREECAPFLNEEQFKDVLQLSSISINKCGDLFQFVFDAQGLFTDHSICVPCSLKEGCIEAKI